MQKSCLGAVLCTEARLKILQKAFHFKFEESGLSPPRDKKISEPLKYNGNIKAEHSIIEVFHLSDRIPSLPKL